jgi:hypothetical protein
MPEQPVSLSPQGPPETVLDPEPADTTAALAEALGRPLEERRDAVAAVVARWPRSLDAWAALGEHARDPVEAYACFRVGYHRGLDRLRQSGWRGSGYVRWRHETNRGFLRSLDGLRAAAATIGEVDEEQRCAEFLLQLDPEWQRVAHRGPG